MIKEKQATIVDEVHRHELAPSTQLKDTEVLEILSHLFGIQAYDYRSLIVWMEEQRQQYVIGQAVSSDVQQRILDLFAAQYSAHFQRTLHIFSKEASGYTMLGNFSEMVCEMLEDKYDTKVFRIDPQYHVSEGKKYVSDQAVLQLVMGNRQVLVVWEYKPKVAANLIDVTGWHLSETLVQAYYLRKKHYPILHCLTDLQDFHYFFIEEGENLKLGKYVYIRSDLTNQTDVWNHINFLFQSVNVVVHNTE